MLHPRTGIHQAKLIMKQHSAAHEQPAAQAGPLAVLRYLQAEQGHRSPMPGGTWDLEEPVGG